MAPVYQTAFLYLVKSNIGGVTPNGQLDAAMAGGWCPECWFVEPPAGGIAELPDVSGSSGPDYITLAGCLGAAAVLALTAGAWYGRRRFAR